MATKIKSIEDCVVVFEGERRCVYCGAVLADGQVCTCANFVSTCTKLAKADQCQEKVEYYANKKQAYLDSIKPPRYEFRMTFVRVEDETTDDGGGNGGSTSDGSGDEGGVPDEGGGSENLGEEQGGEE